MISRPLGRGPDRLVPTTLSFAHFCLSQSDLFLLLHQALSRLRLCICLFPLPETLFTQTALRLVPFLRSLFSSSLSVRPLFSDHLWPLLTPWTSPFSSLPHFYSWYSLPFGFCPSTRESKVLMSTKMSLLYFIYSYTPINSNSAHSCSVNICWMNNVHKWIFCISSDSTTKSYI